MYGHVIHFFLFFCLVKLFFPLVCSYFYHYGEKMNIYILYAQTAIFDQYFTVSQKRSKIGT